MSLPPVPVDEVCREAGYDVTRLKAYRKIDVIERFDGRCYVTNDDAKKLVEAGRKAKAEWRREQDERQRQNMEAARGASFGVKTIDDSWTPAERKAQREKIKAMRRDRVIGNTAGDVR